MKLLLCFLLLFFCNAFVAQAQRKLPPKSKEQKSVEKRVKKNEKRKEEPPTELRWNPRKLPGRSKGYPEISAWHTGTAGIIPSNAAEVSLFGATRIGFSQKTELLVRIAEEPFLPNLGVKHAWWHNKRFFLASEHTLYSLWPGLKMLQTTGFKSLVADSVSLPKGVAMRHEVVFSWLMNVSEWGCPDPASEKILSLRAGAEVYAGSSSVAPFDYGYALYHTQLLAGRALYYGGLQFDSYFNHRFHYSFNGLFYNIDFGKDYAAEANVRFTCYVSPRFGVSLAGKAAYMKIDHYKKWSAIPFLDFTYLIHPGRTTIKHGLQRNAKRRKI